MPPQGEARKRSVGRRYSSFVTLHRRVGAGCWAVPDGGWVDGCRGCCRSFFFHSTACVTDFNCRLWNAAERGAGAGGDAWPGPAAPPQPGGREPQVRGWGWGWGVVLCSAVWLCMPA